MENNMSLKERCIRIRQIDELSIKLSQERDKLYHSGLTKEQHNKLFVMVGMDRKPHTV